MIQKAIEYIVGLSKPNQIIDENGEIFTDKHMNRLRIGIHAETIHLNTLTSLVDYIRDNPEVFFEKKIIVHVVSPTCIKVFAQNSEAKDLENKVYLEVDAKVPGFKFGNWYGNEEFVINVMSKFIGSSFEELSGGMQNDKEEVLHFAGTVQDGTVANYGDNGVSQSATVKTGILETEDRIIPNPVQLIPYRTFVEVEQPVSKFVFRMKSDKYDGVCCALFEADGGAWENEAMQNIKAYLVSAFADIKEELGELKVIVIA